MRERRAQGNTNTTDFSRGYLAVDFPTEPFHSVGGLLLRSVRVFLSNLGFLTAVTLVVFLPGKLLLQLACWLGNVPIDGVLSAVLLDLSDLVLGALVAPAVIYGLLGRFRGGSPAPLAEALAWGRRQWAKSLWNRFKVEITVMLWSALLLVPGIVAMVKLAFTDPIVAIEADREREVLGKSRALTQGHRWRIFLALLPLWAAELVVTFLVFSALQRHTDSRLLIALVDSLFSVGGQWSTVIVLLMYLGLRAPEKEPLTPANAQRPNKRLRRAA